MKLKKCILASFDDFIYINKEWHMILWIKIKKLPFEVDGAFCLFLSAIKVSGG
jgi:hypothetical protein